MCHQTHFLLKFVQLILRSWLFQLYEIFACSHFQAASLNIFVKCKEGDVAPELSHSSVALGKYLSQSSLGTKEKGTAGSPSLKTRTQQPRILLAQEIRYYQMSNCLPLSDPKFPEMLPFLDLGKLYR